MSVKMKVKVFSATVLLMLILSGCGHTQTAQMVNKLSFSTDKISEMSYEFEARTKNGIVNTNFKHKFLVKDDIISDTIGADPTVKIRVETRNGNIDLFHRK